MADELPETLIAPVTPVSTAEPKKKRAPRRSKEEIAAADAAKKNAKSGLKQKVASTAAATADAAAKSAAKRVEKPVATKAASKVPQGAAAPTMSASDDFADLLQLEAENQKLRKSLAEKLRAENADLRKKLGLA